MYKIDIMSEGNCHVCTGARFCFSKRALKNAIDFYRDRECDFTIYKFIYINSGLFAWSKDDAYISIEKFYN